MAHPHTEDAAARINSTIWLDIEEVAARFSVTPSTIWRWTREQRIPFPAPVRLTPRVTRWRLEDIETFEAEIVHITAA